MRFKEFYLLESEDQDIFYKTFNKYHKKGFFGDLVKEDILPQQREWYNDFIQLIKERDEDELMLVLSSKEHKLSREYFTEITGINIKHQTKEKVMNLIHQYISEAKGVDNVQQGSET